ncbi:MAG TPA: SMP-30/gluconolactonase/LRE family protein [Candidatus Paceibacterota bacterium]|nr:SMP-30/gluconolactonase/LRE family protein [Verrucomicrobiota bacterium]HRZ46591.1 SMP-30/gluconolactonase/LRE family protein [Candidatus Paceibacterota bacterium]HRZ91944.1 SMP-30/gluconolactonase/LRE family protein [Candidatus Paceibacterota bacterium]
MKPWNIRYVLSAVLSCLALSQAQIPAGDPAPAAAMPDVAQTAAAIIAPGAKVELLADGFEFTEGPAADREGNVYFTDQPNDRILKWSLDGKLTTFLQPCGRANGLDFDAKGNLLACADEKNQLWSIAPDGRIQVLIERFEGKLLNGPNDLWVHPKGGIYFTDPFYRRNYWKRGEKEQDGEHVYLFDPARSTLARVATDLVRPNGIVGDADGLKLYVADIGAGKTYRYAILEDGRLAEKTLFTNLGSDGMALDAEGNLYLTGKGVSVFNAVGEKIAHIPINESWTANVAFGGRDRQTLFITARDSLYAVRTRVRGL